MRDLRRHVDKETSETDYAGEGFISYFLPSCPIYILLFTYIELQKWFVSTNVCPIANKKSGRK